MLCQCVMLPSIIFHFVCRPNYDKNLCCTYVRSAGRFQKGSLFKTLTNRIWHMLRQKYLRYKDSEVSTYYV